MKRIVLFVTLFAALVAVCLPGCNPVEEPDGSVKVSSITLNETSYTLEPGQTLSLVATVNPSAATDKTVPWTSSNTSVASVSNGTVTALAEGNTTITASAGGKSAQCAITVIAKSINVEGVKAGLERDALKEKVEGMYKLLKVDDQADAIAALSKEDAFDGEDLGQLMVLITSKFGADVEFDYSDNNKIFLRKNGMYKVISLVVKTKSGSERVFAFSPVSKTSWKIAAYNAALDDPCEKSSADEKSALKNIVTCPEDE